MSPDNLVQGRCKTCRKAAMKRSAAASHRRNRYGLDDVAYNKLLKDSNGCCAVCHRPYEIPFIDHDHDTKKVREILCRFCNTGLGIFGDNVVILENAIAYLRKHKEI
jgi:hypothetical protein